MKKLFLLIIIIFQCNCDLIGQSVDWKHMFEVNSLDATAGFPTNAVVTREGSVLMAAVEENLLNIYKFSPEGEIEKVLNIQGKCGEISKIQEMEGLYVMIFDSEPFGEVPRYKILYFLEDLAILQLKDINFPVANHSIFSDFFFDSGDLFFIFHTSEVHQICRKNEVDSVDLVFSIAGDVIISDEIINLENGDLLIATNEVLSYVIRRINLSTGQMVWEINVEHDDILLDFGFEVDGDLGMLGSIQREWVDGDQMDIIKIWEIDIIDGNILSSNHILLESTCIERLDDLIYDQENEEIIIVYSKCFPESNLEVVKINNTFEVEKTHEVQVGRDLEGLPFFIGNLFFRNENGFLLVYRNFKDEIEHGNLQFLLLDDDLESEGHLDVNFDEKNYSEYLGYLIFADEETILVTGFVPNEDPNIAWEELQYFLIQINLDNSVSNSYYESKEIVVFPNPVADILHFSNDEAGVEYRIINSMGQIQTCVEFDTVSAEVSCLTMGMYFLEKVNKVGNRHLVKFKKN